MAIKITLPKTKVLHVALLDVMLQDLIENRGINPANIIRIIPVMNDNHAESYVIIYRE